MTSTTSTPASTNSTAKALTAERAAQVVNSTAQLMRQLRDSSHSEVVAQLPKELSSKVPNIKNTGKLLYQMPSVVLALDSHMDSALNSSSHLGKLKQLLMTDEDSKPQQDS
ncbi:hypothetical protein MPTK1_7g14610 [Marchantia polymorpha subsp. ruderalis]|uniref:BLOC-1-related complex subunit 7 n=2 Tax=Marchantia polymorpha TaxID=3197 RepID=A0A176VI05_MARPO|nr:hypothetical protein AXG93_4273s1220 [Marchantia polymorpha subsp. ruderalis]PTQ47055.1 hypothetical protein MARPO_0009s0146 [Marchantia polymorpha]PTQ47056.1 hypothetical protein MARPO_0009s0146 [Marchantia polymorpha]BBN17449.1 hypothetical protein Mp_7g14610 [Marchantia polymorpha subsp. ruderalis]BBN17450.1 hypothetical protein Mp_7g14610 [Marchantia polymorpha subsp. ruderalis]|eukprot:PTQ47055.1 hypothetical protein MARPO_0009s0146 [Marchantia polymorpha]